MTEAHPPSTSQTAEVLETQTVDCCIVGGGPAGAVLALLLARQGISVALLEKHKDFDREFRGDTLHPSAMEIMAQLGLAERLLQLPHTKLRRLSLQTPTTTATLADFSHLKTPFPYITVLPQERFLEFITTEAQHYPGFHLVMGANVQDLVWEQGEVRGVRYRGHGGWHEVRAKLTVGADGRFSQVRQRAELEPMKTSPPMDVLWFRLPRRPGDVDHLGIGGYFSQGHLVALIDRHDYWQVGYVILKGTYQQLRSQGIEALRQAISTVVPGLSDRVDTLQDWSQISFLAVESSRVPQWYRPGLLLIGDAAHVMSPVGGVGINYAIQDAVVAANVLSQPLRAGKVEVRDLAAVQQRRIWPTRMIQAFQTLVQKQIIANALNPEVVFQPPALLRIPILQDLPARLIALGIWPVRLKPEIVKAG